MAGKNRAATAAPEQAVLEGYISVRAALDARSRRVSTVYIQRDKWDPEAISLETLARALNVRIERVPVQEINARASGRTHGGILAVAGPRRYVALEDLTREQSPPFVVMLEGVEDPFNFGQAVRSLYAAGAGGLVLRGRDWASAAGVIARSSAGASEQIPTAVVEDSLEAASYFKGQGLRVACAAREPGRSVPLFDADLSGPLLLMIGGEKRGIPGPVLDVADVLVEIPYGREFAHSLGATAATAVLAFEVMRQRASRS